MNESDSKNLAWEMEREATNQPIPTHGAAQMAAEIDKVIEAYQRVKARLLDCGEALDGWHVCPDPAFNRLFQIHRIDSRKLDAQTVMDAIGGEWVSEQTE